MIIIDSSVWIPLLRGEEHPKVERARELIRSPEDIGIPGIVLEEVLRGIGSDAQFRRTRDLLTGELDYLDVTRDTFIRSASIYRTLRKRGHTIGSVTDCLIAACAIEHDARLLEDDRDFEAIAAHFPLALVE